MNKSLLITLSIIQFSLCQTIQINSDSSNTQNQVALTPNHDRTYNSRVIVGCKTRYVMGIYSGCKVCEDGYFRDRQFLSAFSYICKRCAYGCGKCTGSVGCQQCKIAHYMTTEGTCANCPEGCSFCSPDNKCFSCLATYFLQPNQSCLKCNIGCDSCENQNTCLTCSSKFFKNAELKCSPCEEGCEYCTSLTTCQSCGSGYTLKEGRCNKISGFTKFLIVCAWIIAVVLICFSCVMCMTFCNSQNQTPTNQNVQDPNAMGNTTTIPINGQTYVPPPTFIPGQATNGPFGGNNGANRQQFQRILHWIVLFLLEQH